MKLVYIAGPYRGSCPWETDLNIQNARQSGAAIARIGYFPVVPHANTAHYDGVNTDTFWLAGTLELMRRCDVVVMTGAWEESRGSVAERKEAKTLGIPVYDSLVDALRGLPRV